MENARRGFRKGVRRMARARRCMLHCNPPVPGAAIGALPRLPSYPFMAPDFREDGMSSTRGGFLALIAGLAASLIGLQAHATAPAPTPITPEMVEAAQQEGKGGWYTSVELRNADKVAKAVEAQD